MPRDAEVIVVGGGPAGAATAGFLARAGVDVLVLDRAVFPRDKPCAEYLSPQAAQPLDDLGVLAMVEAAAGARLHGMRVSAPDGTTFLGEFASQHGFRGFRDHGIAIRRTRLDHVLLQHARGLGARVEEGTAVQELVRDGRRVTGVIVHGERGARTFHAPLVIGADGLRSVVGRRLGLTRVGHWPRRFALVTHYRGIADVGALGEMHVYANGYAGLAAVGDGEVNVAVVVPAGAARAMRGAPGQFLDHWLAAHPVLHTRFRQATRTSPVLVTGPFNTRARRGWAPGVALVGDAAEFFDPFTGEGIHAALRGAQLLLPYAFEACRAASGSRQDVALAAWDRARHDVFVGKWRVERLVGTAVGVPWVFNHLARALARRRDLADLLVGVAGDFVPPREVLRPRFLLDLVFHRRGSGAAATPSMLPEVKV